MTFLSTIAALAATVQPSPSTLIEEWLTSLNAGSLEACRVFHRRAPWPAKADEVAEQSFALFRRTGGFTRVRDLPDREGRTEVLVRAKLIDDYRIFAIGKNAEGALEPSVTSPPRALLLKEVPVATRETLPSRVQAYIQGLARAGRFSGAYALAEGDVVLAKGAFGLAHRGFGVKNRFDTKFNLASMGKMFTAIAIGRLVDAGKLRFDTKIGEILPDYPNATVRDQVTLRMLLSHSSGLGDMFTPAFVEGSKDRWKTVDSVLPLFQDEPLRFEPGKGQSYSNAGYVLLGKVIEKVSGQEYWRFLEEQVFDPLGMKDTGAFEMDRDTPNLAFGYTNEPLDGSVTLGEPYNNLFMHIAKGSPAGGSFSTVPDLLKFATGLRSGKLVRPATLRTMTTLSQGFPDYGLGFQLRPLPSGGMAYGHGGGFPGISGELIIYPGSGYTFVALANYDLEAMRAVARVRMLVGDVISDH
ncbi:MAG TPA: serine hydrolase domain-containing protein [Fimbriimonadaceae bacterium]|nr:serine hydrolase domain-containing protein [Fimbriimonadaceae bacterium]